MDKDMLSKRLYLILCLIASIISLSVLVDWPHHQVGIFVIFFFALYVSHTAYKWGKIWATWLFGFIASLFVSIWMIGAPRQLMDIIGQPMDIICAVLFAIVAFILKKPAKEKEAPRYLRENFGVLAFLGILAMAFFVCSIDSFVKAKTNHNGGYIPIYAGNAENREWVDDEWVGAAQYTQNLKANGKFILFLSVIFGWAFFYFVIKEKSQDLNIVLKAAEQGDADAQFNLGLMYYKCPGVEFDFLAVKWLTKAAKQGHASAQFYLGFMYQEGKRFFQDYDEAIDLYTKSAEQGNAQAQYNLGVMYDNGKGVTQDYVSAHKWFNLSAAQGNEDAIKDRDLLKKKMTPSQIEEAQRLIKEFKPKSKSNSDKYSNN